MSTLLTTSVLELFISFLRPTGPCVGEENFDLSERLSQIADSNENLDDSLNVMMNTFETNMRFLQSVGHLIQWMATHIISQVTQLRSHALSSNEISISRQILLIMKLWTTLHNNCSPLYTIKDIKCDPLSESYAILSKAAAAQNLGENISIELYESCELLKCRVSTGKVSMKKPQIANLKGQSFQVGKLVKQRASLLIDDTDFVRRTTVGREETRDLRHCSRSGAYTYNRQESLISGWDHRFLKRSMCGGLWTNISSSPTKKKPYVPALLCQEFI
ncbi:unnamed protein product [Oikopleura dioica]|uniref:Mediator of RNA polymerase II transcription subunit 16 central helical bridge domain-containing protein n=1 Tax=Oikopleura dioica TaxID=34765 RepID=E4XFU1_OIKDI|nr:unnamed protein product [Oikopleura dioica]